MNPWSTACPDWEDRILESRSLVPELPLFREEADAAVRVFKRLRVPDITGTPMVGDICGDWVLPIVEAVFGSYDLDAGVRMLQEFFLLISKKNWKTGLGATIMLTALIRNYRPEAELTLIAPTKDVADRAFRQASGSIRLDAKLSKLFHIQRHVRSITHRTTGAVLLIRAADTDVITGSKSTFTLVDETHVFADHSRAADVFLELRGALAARQDGFLFQITTQSKRSPAGVFRQELHNARDVRDGRLDLPLLPVLYEFPRAMLESDEWRERRYWGLVNPNMGRSVNAAFLEREFLKADRSGPAAMALFASQHLDVEVGLSLRTDRWPGAEYWMQRADPTLTLEVILDRSEVVVVGLDGGGLDDLFGMAVLGRDLETQRWLLWSHAWCHTSVLERRKTIAPRLLDFATAGELTIVDDRLDDLSEIVKIVGEIQERGLLGAVGVDPAGIGELVDALATIDITQDNKLLVGIAQGFRLMNAIKTSERRLASGTLWHSGSSLMAWCVENLKIEPTATAIRATKQNVGDLKIDAAMAMFDAVDLMSSRPSSGESIYNTPARAEGFLVL
jgi:phage terminase large subunit-like protein